MSNKYNNEIFEHRRNFISPNSDMAINSYGEVFTIGQRVVLESDSNNGNEESQIIIGFKIDKESNEVSAVFENNWAHIDFIEQKDKKADFSCEVNSTYGVEEIRKARLAAINEDGIDFYVSDPSDINESPTYESEVLSDIIKVLSSLLFAPSPIKNSDKIKKLTLSGAIIAGFIDRIITEEMKTNKKSNNEENYGISSN